MQTVLCPFCMKTVQDQICPYCGNSVNYAGHHNHLPVGFTLQGRSTYVLGAALGQGGFGITYIALDVTSGQRVAIKEYYPSHCCGRTHSLSVESGYGQEETFNKGKQHFIMEAQMLQSLSDLDSVVKVLDYFEINNTAYLVMEYLDGLSLKDHVEKNGKLDAQQFLIRMKPLMADMEKMHRRGVVHRDIAPDNIIMLPDGRLKLIDFGAARSYVGDKSMTVVVKKGFAPVEQYMRKGSNASTDVYALAATIYYCITGIVPPDSAERQYGDAQLQAPTSLGVELSRQQEQALEKALEIQPKARTQSVAELMQALEHLPKSMLQKQEEERRRQEALRKKQEEDRLRQEKLRKQQEKDKLRQEALLKKQEDDRRQKELLRKQREEERRQREELRKKQKKPSEPKTKTDNTKPAKQYALIAAAVVVVLAGALLIPRFTDRGDMLLSAQETEVPVAESTVPAETLPAPTVATVPETQPTIAETEPAADIYYMATNESIFPERGSSTDAGRLFWGQSKWAARDVRTITFVDSLDNAPSNAEDVSIAHDGTVLAWMDSAGNLTVGANGKISPDPSSESGYRSGVFSHFNNLKRINFGTCFDTSAVTSMHYMFYDCRSLVELDLSSFDTSNVTDMHSMFGNCYYLTSLDLSNFNTHSVTDMSSMFYNCASLEELDISSFDTSNVTDMSLMFSRCDDLTSLDLSHFDTSNVTDMSRMFYSCESLGALDISRFDTSNVTDMSRMFYQCKFLKALDINSFDTSNVTDMSEMFAMCQSLTELDLSSFDVSNVTNFQGMFNSCPAEKPDWY